MSKSPENIEQPKIQQEAKAGAPSKERQRELKKAAKDAAKRKQAGVAQSTPQPKATRESRSEAVASERETQENMMREAQTLKEAREIFELFKDEGLVTEERFREIMRARQKEREAVVAVPTAPITLETEAPEEKEEGVPEEPTVGEGAVEETGEAGGEVEAGPFVEPEQVEEKEVQAVTPEPTGTAEAERSESETATTEQPIATEEQPRAKEGVVEGAKPESSFLSRVKQSLDRLRAIEREKRERAQQERWAQRRTTSGRVEEKGKQAMSTKGRVGERLRTAVGEARGEFADEGRFLEDDFIPSPELAQKNLRITEIRAEAESLWENVRDREFTEGLIPTLQVIARKDALANYLEREARVVEMNERHTFIEKSRWQETAPRTDRDYREYLEQMEPHVVTVEERYAEKPLVSKIERERKLKLVRNIGNFADALRREMAGPKKERRYETSREYGKKLELLWKISRAENVDLALKSAQDKNLLGSAEYEKIIAGLREKEEVAPDLNGYMRDIDLRYASGEIEEGEDWDRLKAVAERVFGNPNPAGGAEKARVLQEISAEERDQILHYIKRPKEAQ